MEISFEVFPPKTEQGQQKLTSTIEELNHFNPDYVSVTFGAGGSSQNQTQSTVFGIQKLTKEVVPHISGICCDKEEINNLLYTYQEKGIKKLVVLRGDLPQQLDKKNDFPFALDLIQHIKKHYPNFYLFIAAYPEIHPQAKNMKQDFQNFKNKIDAGANAAITQYFYNIEAYENFLELCQKENINIPIFPGIMPIYDVHKLEKFSDLCGADLPRWLRKNIENLDKINHNEMLKFGVEFVSNLCKRLIELKVPGIHFYTLNKHETIQRILKNLNL